MSDDNRVDVAITVTSDGAEQGASKAADSIARAIGLMQRDLQQMVQQSRATTAAVTAGFTGMASSIDGMAGRMSSSVRQVSGVVDDYGNEVVAVSRRVQQANAAEEESHRRLGHSSVAARRELLVLGHEMMMGNYKRFVGSLMVLGEQMDWMGKIMSPTGIAIGSIAGALAIMASAAIHGALQMSHLRDELILTGDYAGLTGDRFITMGNDIAAATGAKITAARDALQAVAATGRFTGVALQPVSEAIAKIGQFSNATAEEVVKSFEKMDDGVYKWAMEYNKSYHFANMAQIEHIRLLEEQGDKERAEAETAQLVIAKINETAAQLGYLPGLWHDVRNAASGAWDAMMNWGRPVTIDDQIKRVRDSITEAQNNGTGIAAAGGGFNFASVVEQQTKLDELLKRREAQHNQADATARSEALQLKGAEAVRTLRGEWKRLGGDVQLADEEVKRFRLSLDQAKAAAKDSNTPIPDDVKAMIARQPQIEEEIRKKYDRHDFKKTPGAITPMRDYAFENAQDQAHLNLLKENLKAEQAELDRAYKANQVSLQSYFAERLAITLRGMDAERDVMKAQLGQTRALEAQARNPAERLSLRTKEVEIEGRLAVAERQRAAAVQQNSQEMRAAIDAELKALQDLDAKRAESQASEEQKRAVLVAQEEVRQGRITQAQLAALEEQYEQQKADKAIQALQQRLETEKNLTVQAQRQIQDQIDQIRDQSATRQLQYSIQENDAVEADARRAADSIDQGFAKAFGNFVDGTQTAWQAFNNFARSIDQMLVQMVSKKLFQQLFEMPMGEGGSSASGYLTGWLGMLLGDHRNGGSGNAPGAFGFSTGLEGSARAVASGMNGGSALMGLGAGAGSMNVAQMSTVMQNATTLTASTATVATMTVGQLIGGDTAGSAASGLTGLLGSLIPGGGDFAGAFGFSSGLEGSAGAVTAGIMGADAGGMSALMGLASFDVGTPYVPNDMIAQIHRGEAIVPAHMNSPYSAGAGVTVTNQFVLPNGVDLRTQSQIASMAGMAVQQALKRNA
ncbi:prophage tail length tape measure [Burkholderia pseudomallei]|uniref:phage tail length tape measure family protein n=1 Tax=Burkholderia pseudomallei TaxID=28450 RepID=UPI0005DCE195|nr:phage tail length tape measure family protein [Burkholderia pseudomallei]CFT62813.1 prophage tail length tape measure [Burkholderia pseudomallei]CPG92077.1 prophage tail length tape measure [Burkholderia pseudomallei]